MTLNVAYTANAIPPRSRNAPGTLAHELHSFVQSPGNLMGQPRAITMPDGSEWYVKNFTHTIRATNLPTIELTLVGIPKRAEEEAAMTAEEAMKVENVAKWIDPEPPVRLKSITPVDADTVEVQAEVAVPYPVKKIDIQLTMPEENKGPLSDPELLEAIDKRWPKKPKLERKDAFWRDEEKK